MNKLFVLQVIVAAFLLSSSCGEARHQRATVTQQTARGPMAEEGEYICFEDLENEYHICFKEGPPPSFKEGEPGFGSQTYVGYYTPSTNTSETLGYVYGHSRAGRANVYLSFFTEDQLMAYTFDYCPQVWKIPAKARFSVYHVIKGELDSVDMETFTKPPFEQENENIGLPGGRQEHCSIEKFGIAPPPPPPPPAPEGRSFSSRALEVQDTGNVLDGFCFNNPFMPDELWYFVGGYGEFMAGEGRQIHQYYKGKVEDFNSGGTWSTYGHAPRGQRLVVMTSYIPSQGYVTYGLEFDARDQTRILSSFSYTGSPDQMEFVSPFQRSEVVPC